LGKSDSIHNVLEEAVCSPPKTAFQSFSRSFYKDSENDNVMNYTGIRRKDLEKMKHFFGPSFKSKNN
jgi:hypothetical protein